MSNIVLVTGGTGFLGSHVVHQLLEGGHTVRAAIRPGKATGFRATHPNAGDKLQVVEIADIAEGDFTDAFKGVKALIHVAAPTYVGESDSAVIVKGAVKGTINVVSQAVKSGSVKKIVLTSSIAALVSSDLKSAMSNEPLTDKSWNDLSPEMLPPDAPAMFAYVAGKTAGEKEFWKLAEQYREIDFTAIVAPAIYGPLVPNFPRPATRAGLSTVDFVYKLVTGGDAGPNTYPGQEAFISNLIDVRDLAKIHILALTPIVNPKDKVKRLLPSAGQFGWKAAADLVRKERPEVSDRLPPVDLPEPEMTKAPMDGSLAEEVLGFKKYIPWQETILASIDAALAWEKGGATA